jgi:lipopolysaccharide/colanic/teichoic acid biosynthesis glycosyltransferase
MLQDSSKSRTSPLHPLSKADRALKRAIDLLFAIGGLILLSPLLAIVAAALKHESSDPVLVKKLRYSCCNSPLSVYEFRTGASHLGRFLRRTRIDELPQLLNVISGDMSLVGPKPHIPAYNDYFQALVDRSMALGFKPGLLSWADLKESLEQSGANRSMRRRIEYDLQYLENWSLWFDLRIILLAITSREILPHSA